MDIHAEYDDNSDNEYDIDLAMFRTKPHRQRNEPLIAAFVKYLTRDNIPSLEDADILMHLWWDPPADIEMKEYGLQVNTG